MALQFVKPYMTTNKTDAADAGANREAVTRPNMRFVGIQTEEQQALLAIHPVRQGFVKARTAQANRICGVLAEFGIVIPQGICRLGHRLAVLVDASTGRSPRSFYSLLQRLADNLKELDRRVKEPEQKIRQWHEHTRGQLAVSRDSGTGPNTADTLVATIGDALCYRTAGSSLLGWA